MTYNLTFNGAGLDQVLVFTNSIYPPATAIFFIVVPFIIMLMTLTKYDFWTAFTISSFIATISSILMVATGLADSAFLLAFIGLSLIGFIAMSTRK